ncbi:hypothetical protein BGZ91_005837, partial [Linnemannia elongata]
QDASAGTTPDHGQAATGQDKDPNTSQGESQGDVSAPVSTDTQALPASSAPTAQAQGTAEGSGQDLSSAGATGAGVGGVVADPNALKQAPGSEVPAVSGASAANMQGPGAPGGPTATSTGLPESTLGFAQAMMAVPVPVITLPSSLPHGHAPHGHVDAAKVSAQPAAPSKVVPAPVKEPSPVVEEPPMTVAYHPITRAVDTYGGIDILAMEKFHIPHYVPAREHLGAVDIHALIMSLKSGMKMEVTTALNTLSTLTKQDSDNLQLARCPELLDTILDLTEETFDSWKVGEGIQIAPAKAEPVEDAMDTELCTKSDSPPPPIFSQRACFDTYEELFEASVDEACHLMEIQPSSRMLVDDQEGDSDTETESSQTTLRFQEWSSNKDQFLALSNLLRNLSFSPGNFEFLAQYPRFLQVLKGTLLKLQMKGLSQSFGAGAQDGKSDTNESNAVRSSDDDNNSTATTTTEEESSSRSLEETYQKNGWLPSTGALTILEHRKDILTILANLSGYLILPDSDSAQWIMILILDFLQAQDTYYASLALEAVAKLGISHDNRNRSHHNHHQLNFDGPEKWESGGFLLPLFESISAMLAQALTRVTAQQATGVVMPHSGLAHLETLMLAAYNLAALSEMDFRRYMVLQPGFVSCLLRLSVILADVRTPAYTSASMRTVETLRVVSKDNEHLLVQYTEVIAKAAMQPHIHPKVLDDLMCVL